MVAFGSSYKHLSTVPLAIDGFGQMTSVTSPPGDPAETDNPPGISDDPGASQPTGFSPTAFPTTGAPAAPLDPIHDWQIDEDEMWVRQEKTSCLSPGEQPVSNDELLLSSHLDLIQQTSLGAAMMRDLQGFSTAICLDSDYELGSRTGGIYSQLYRAVIIRRSLTTLQRTQILAHELRHAWHDQQGVRHSSESRRHHPW